MSQILWQTKKGELATVQEGSYFEYQLSAKDSQGLSVSYSLISGTLSSGLQLFRNGLIQGVPVVEFTSAAVELKQTFTIRATNTQGKIADRTFSIVTNVIASPTIVPRNVSLGTVYDGYFLDIQLTAIELSPTAVLTWEQISGELPSGVTLTLFGRLFGNIKSFHTAEAEALLGWGNTGWNEVIWDSPTATAQTKTYQFAVQVADGTRFDSSTYTLKVQAKSLFTVDSSVISANDGILTVDTDNKHVPFITTVPSDLPEQRQDSNFAFKIDGEDLDGDVIRFGTVVYGQSEFDQGPTLDNPNTTDNESVLQVAAFDQFGFDQGGQSLPPGVSLDPETGWLTGHLEAQVEEKKTYSFSVFCYKKDYPASKSTVVTFTLTVLGSRNNTVTWFSPEYLGEMNNGSVSEFAILAKSNLGKVLNYRLVEGTKYPLEIYSDETPGSHYDGFTKYTPQARSRLPQGLKLLPDGLIVGRAAFNFFSLDGGSTTFDKKATDFDNVYQFSVTASDEIDGVKSATIVSNKTFTIRIHNWNQTPYENIYLRALPNREQRISFTEMMNNESIFPSELLYRKADDWFGKAKDIKFLFAAGLNPSLASTYLAEMQHNHYNKLLNLSNVKTAVALDENFQVKYEIVYVAVTDPLTENNKSPAIQMDRSTQVIPQYNVTPFSVIYPNSFDNMKTEVTAVGYENKGALPSWMVNQQEDGRVLGFTRGVVLAYTVPGASKLIAFRLQQHNVDFNKIDFVADRYQLDHTLSSNFDIAAAEFIESKETTFDRLPMVSDIHPFAGAVDFALTVPFDEVNGRTLEYLARAGDADGATFKSGQLVIFAIQEHFSRPANEDIAYTKDTFDTNGFDLMAFNLSYVPKQYSTLPAWNNGWNLESGLFGAEPFAAGVYSGLPPYYDPSFIDGFNPEYYDDAKYCPSTIIPGYVANTVGNIDMRGGIWRVDVSDSKLVTLTFVQVVNPMEYIRVKGGSRFGGAKVFYNVNTGGAPRYDLLTNMTSTAGNSTRFDGGATCFYNNKDEYASPGVRDVFLKFPKHGIYR